MKQKKHKPEQLVKCHNREMFNIIENNQNEESVFTLTLGNYKLKDFPTLELADLYLIERPNELIINIISICVEIALKEKFKNEN